MFSADVEDIRMGSLDYEELDEDEGMEPDEPEGGEPDPNEGGMAGGADKPEDMQASEKVVQLSERVDQLADRADSLEAENAKLKGKVDRYERTADAPANRRTPQGDGFSVAASEDGDEDGVADILAADTYDGDEDCIARAEGDLGEGFNDREVAAFAMFKDPDCGEQHLAESIQTKIRQKHGG
jgi:hypothetical protein